MKTAFSGIIAASVTPFNENNTVDLDRFREHLQFLVDGGCSGVLIGATSGEYNSLSLHELETIYKHAVDSVGDSATIYAGIVELSETRGIEAARAARRAGVDALLAAPPFFVKPTLEGVIRYFEALERTSELPIVLYNNPGRVGWSIDEEMLGVILDRVGVVGIKDCERDLGAVGRKIDRFGSRISILSGDDDLGFPTLMLGAVGGVWATPNLFPELCSSIYQCVLRGDFELGRELHHTVAELCTAWFTTNHPAPLKAAMGLLGHSPGGARPPLGPVTGDIEQQLMSALTVAANRSDRVATAK